MSGPKEKEIEMSMAMEMNCEVTYSEDELQSLYGNIAVSIVRVTPELAREWLDANTRNRNLNKRHVVHMADVMSAGDMVLNGETIIFDSNGVLLNGQHRLWGCIKSGHHFDSVVIRNVSPDVFDTLDGGRKRKVGEMLAMNGEQNSSNVASAIAALVAFVDLGGNITGTTCNARTATPQVCERVLASHPGIRDSVKQVRKQKLYDNQWAYVLHYLFQTVDPRLANDFIDVLCSGSPDVGRPFNVFREHLIKNPGGPSERRERAAKAIKAWNAERARERPKMFKFLKGEEFPAIDGLNYDALAATV
jgi:hypothetical protein